MTDDKIILLISEKQQVGLEHLEKKYKSYAQKITQQFLQSPEDAEECINDALFDVWNARNIKEIKNLKAFVAVCVRRRCIDLLRNMHAQKRSQNVKILLSELDEVCAPLSTEDSFENRQLGTWIDRFINALGQPDKDIFLLRYFYGMDIWEIAKQKRLSRSAVDSRLFRCRKKLKASCM